jgi:ankyrin repeat protein
MTHPRTSVDEAFMTIGIDSASMEQHVAPLDGSVFLGGNSATSPILACLLNWDLENLDALLAAAPQLDIFEAAGLGHTERVIELISERPELVNSWCADGLTPLHFACFYGQHEVVRSLLAYGARPCDRARSQGGPTPLHQAASTGQRDTAELLLEHGAEVDARDQQGCTPLHLAAANGDLDIVVTLLRFGAVPFRHNDEQQTARDLAHESGFVEIVERLDRCAIGQLRPTLLT